MQLLFTGDSQRSLSEEITVTGDFFSVYMPESIHPMIRFTAP
ncbi:hypothetical protein HM1_2807 [Heliomicrobium modesticaldum Ice1]|uniref:Uncharacterized protein n=1 Tax=Heliobacterium modesticaldum (strain ATCC 51547 / Ice1) TaxID=498761 RepID=B0TCE8_HELMI|nr:hypothetical protein HM1_2807 [Heliomicrobium modesticaldum Ice1]